MNKPQSKPHEADTSSMSSCRSWVHGVLLCCLSVRSFGQGREATDSEVICDGERK